MNRIDTNMEMVSTLNRHYKNSVANHRVNLPRSGAETVPLSATAIDAPSRAGYAKAVSVRDQGPG